MVYKNLYAVIIDGVLYEQSVSNSEAKSKQRFIDYLHSKISYSTCWATQEERGARVYKIEIKIK